MPSPSSSTTNNTIDYSKWDKLEYSSSDDDDDADVQQQQQQPRVTRLDGPSRVTRTSDGNLIIQQQQQQEEDDNNTNTNKMITNTGNSASTASASASARNEDSKQLLPPPSPPPPPPTNHNNNSNNQSTQETNWTENGSEIIVAKTTTGSSQHEQKLYWSQDRYTVTVRLELLPPPTTTKATAIKGKDLIVDLHGVLPYRERYAAVGTDHRRTSSLKVLWKDHTSKNNNNSSSNSTIVLFEGKFPHPIHAPQSDDDDDDDDPNDLLDWTIDRRVTHHNVESAYFVLTVHKAVPMEGMVIWWKRPFLQFDEMTLNVNPSNNSNNAAFQKAWDEAHRQFREKTKQKHTIT